MTSVQTVDKRFGTITAMGGPNPSPLIAIAGPYHRILHAEKSGERVEFLGESEDLGAEVLAVNNETTPNFHVLTAAGALRVSDADAPQIVTTSEFDPGDGRWLCLFGGSFLATPLARGGVQVLNATTLVQLGQMPGVLSDSRFAANLPNRGYLWVADGKQAQIGVFKVNTSTGALTYVGKVRAPNCRDIIKVVLDDQNGNLFVVCRRRIVRFVVPLTVVDEPLPVFAQDYGVASVDYTDFVVLDENQYWIAQNSPTTPTVLDAFYGPQFGVWDPSLGDAGELLVAAPAGSIWTVNNVIPYYDEDTIGEPPAEPPVIAPEPPVITSSLTAEETEGHAFSYTITATGEGPITFGVLSPPAWLTVDPLTGALSGIAPAPGVVNLTITATNAGGMDTAILVLTVNAAITDLSAVNVNNAVWRVCHIGPRIYITGDFTTVTDASGTYARANGTACLNISTGLWEAWSPSITGGTSAEHRLYADPSGEYVYIFGTFTAINGVAATGARRVDPITGATDTVWIPSSDSGCLGLVRQGSRVYMFGASTLSGATRLGYGAVSAVDGSIDAWRPLDGASSPPTGPAETGAGGAFTSGGDIWYGIRFHGTVAQGFGSANPSSGVAVALTDGFGLTAAHRVFRLAVSGGRVCAVGNWALPSGAVTNNVTGTPTIDMSSFIALFTTGGAFVSTTVLNGEALLEDVAPLSSTFYIAGAFADVGGDASYRGIARLDSSGNLVAAFHPVWGAAPNMRGVDVTEDGFVVAVGDFNTTLNGTPRQGIVVLDSTTGAPF